MVLRKIESTYHFKHQYSICTLVTDQAQYEGMMQSFIQAGFNTTLCEFLVADNTKGNKFEAYRAINRFLQEAQGRYIIVCHQDILINYDQEYVLKERIAELDCIDPKWGIAGNAGAMDLYQMAMVITQNKKLIRKGKFPSKVISLDENFLLIKAEANLAVSGDISGFHLYGTDICLIADCMGWNSYVIDFNISHDSSGRMNPSFYEISNQLQKKYQRFFRGRYIKTTITRFYLGSKWISWFMNLPIIKSLVRIYYKIKSN
ncbi:hypothetical protein [Daejeonella sp.]|uniref:hypothetical protein n=1 Tax=Daejeonella sp. TaxID=2805397 RepID=UPI003983183F